MNGLNKFQALTIVFICMFVFVIAAFYTNTKEEVSKKTNLNNEKMVQNQNNNQNNNQNTTAYDSANEDRQRLYQLIDDVQDLSGKVDEFIVNEGRDKVVCTMEGFFNDGNVEQIPSDTSIQEIKDNGKQLILFCSFGK